MRSVIYITVLAVQLRLKILTDLKGAMSSAMTDPKDLIDIGLVTEVSGIFPLGRREGDKPESAAIRVQMESLSGKIYFASLTVQAAQNIVSGLSKWQPVKDTL